MLKNSSSILKVVLKSLKNHLRNLYDVVGGEINNSPTRAHTRSYHLLHIIDGSLNS